MPLLDRERNVIVLRIVYDGPPEAGKTTSLRALAGSLGQELYTPAEANGRTLFFDWMDYTGGRFEGYQIRCQIVSVPGQVELAPRRAHLLGEADVVVFVADSTRPRLDETMTMLAGLPALVSPGVSPPVGVVLQANKRDLADAVPLADLRARTREIAPYLGVVESVAADGTGIREAFVFAVRLALDRVREMIRTQALPTGVPEIDSGESLLARMQERLAAPAAARGSDFDASPDTAVDVEPVAVPAIAQVLAENEDEAPVRGLVPWREGARAFEQAGLVDDPLPPDPAAPSGAIWPPVEGRLILHEASTPRMTTRRLRSGGWAAGIGSGWRAYTDEAPSVADLELGRAALIQWARLHAANAGVLSPNRCVVLAATGHGTWRLWQIVRAERSLRDHLGEAGRTTPDELARRLIEVTDLLCEMRARLAGASCALPCSLDTVGRSERGPIYIGLMPNDGAPLSVGCDDEQIVRELEAYVASDPHDLGSDAVLAALARAPRHGHATQAFGLLDQLGSLRAAG